MFPFENPKTEKPKTYKSKEFVYFFILYQKIQTKIIDFSTKFFENEKENSLIKTSYSKGDNYDSQRNLSSLNTGAIFVYLDVVESIDFLNKQKIILLLISDADFEV